MFYWGEPHTNRYYEKIAILMYVCVCVCVRDTSSMCCTRARVVDNHFHLEMIVNINIIILERVLADSIEKRSKQSSEDMFHDEIVQEIKEQLGPSYNSLSL